jgi:oligoribonuclease
MLGVFLDTETSGLDPFIHTALELAFVVVDLRSGRELVAWESVLKVSQQDWDKCDKKSLFINGLTWEEVSLGLDKDAAGSSLEKIFAEVGLKQDNGAFICQNPSFDRPFFSRILTPARQDDLGLPYHWLDLASMYWALVLSKRQESGKEKYNLSKDAIAQECGLPPEGRPHRAMNGVRHLLHCYERLVGFPASF